MFCIRRLQVEICMLKEWEELVVSALGQDNWIEILDGCDHCSEYVKSIAREGLKPWRDFATGLQFPPFDKSVLIDRMFSNFSYFHANYFQLFCFILSVQLLFAPLVIAVFLIVISWYIFVMILIKQPMVVGDFEMDNHRKLVVCSVVALLFIVFTGAMERLFVDIVVAVIVCLLHMAIHEELTDNNAYQSGEQMKRSLFSAFEFAGAPASEHVMAQNMVDVESYAANPFVGSESPAAAAPPSPAPTTATKRRFSLNMRS